MRNYRSWPRRPLRVGAIARLAVAGCGRLAPRVREYFRANFFADAEAHTEGALRLAFDMYGLDRMLFRADFLREQHPPPIEYLRENAPEEGVEQTLHSKGANGISLPASPGSAKVAT